MANSAVTKRGKIFISSATASSSSSIAFTNLDSSRFTYHLYWTNVDMSTDAYLRLRTSTNNGSSYDSGASDYDSGYHYATVSSSTGHIDASNTTSFIYLNYASTGGATNETTCGWSTIYNPGDTKYTYVNTEAVGVSTVSNPYISSGHGVRLSAADVDAIQITPSSGTITSGEFYLFATRK